MNEDGERFVGIAPIDIVELEALRIEQMRSRSDYVCHRHASD
jgi:hypothetical protein